MASTQQTQKPAVNPPERTAAIQTIVGHIVRQNAETLRKLAKT